MQLLGIDIGSSSVKCALLRNGKVAGKIVHAKYATRIDGSHVEVDPPVLLKAVQQAIHDVGSNAKKADAIALSVFSPGWVGMDADGRPLTPIVTHQDRRSVEIAHALEKKVGEDRYYKLAGTRPFPGGISSTTWAWYLANQPASLKKAHLVGHLNTFLHRQFTGARVIDPANASFMGVYATADLSGWSPELCDAVGPGIARLLPEIRDADRIGGTLTRSAATRLGLPVGLPMTVGVVDGSAAMFATPAHVGQLLNVCGSTDVLALCTNRFSPHPELLTRALGIGRMWLSVSTIAASGSAISWAKDLLFPDLGWPAFERLALGLANTGPSSDRRRHSAPTPFMSAVQFSPYLAGDRMSMDQKQAAFTGLTLAATRERMLSAVLESLARASAARIALLKSTGTPIRRDVVVTGGAGGLTGILHRDWPGQWKFRQEEEATLKGLAQLEPKDDC